MKILKFLLYGLIALILIAIVLGLVGPKTFDINRKAVVSGTTDQVWPYVSQLKHINSWSPWAEKDTAIVLEYTGTEGTVGSSVSWSGNKDVGVGSQTISVLDPEKKYLETALHFKEPMESEATSYTMLKDTTGGTLVTWGIKGNNNFVGRIFASLMNFEKMMAPDFEKGLANLTNLMASVPKDAAAGGGMEVVAGEYAGGKYLGIRSKLSFDKMEEFYGTSFAAILPVVEKSGAKMAGAPSGLYYTWDEKAMTTDMAAAIPFTGDLKAPKGMEVVELPAGKSLTINYKGGYHGLGNAHMAMDAYLSQNKLEAKSPVIEEYITDPGTEPDSNKWVTKVVYLVK